MIRTPWPSRSAPHHWIACQIDGSPKASPAWIVKWEFSRWRYSNASRWRVGGNPASAPAMSKPATPRSRQAIASSAISTRPGLVPHRGQQLADDDPAAAGGHPLVEALLDRRDDLVERQAAARRAARARSAPRRRRRRRRPGPRRTRGRPASMRRPGLHHGDGVVEGLEVAHQRAGVGRLGEPAAERRRRRRPGSSWPISAASSMIVCGPQPAVEVVVQQDLRGRAGPARVAGRGRSVSRTSSQATHGQALGAPMRTFTTLDDVAAAAGAGARHQRLARRRPGPRRRVRRRHRRPPVDPRRRRARAGRAVRRHHRPRLPDPVA